MWADGAVGASIVVDRLQSLGETAVRGVIGCGLAATIIAGTWILARVLAWCVRTVLRRMRYNSAAHRIWGEGAWGGGEPAAAAGVFTYWAVMTAGVVGAFDVLGIPLSRSLMERFTDVLPRIATAAILLSVGFILAIALGAFTRRFFETSGLSGGRVRGSIVTALFTFFAVLLSLEQLGLAVQFVMSVGVVLAATVGLGISLAFGVGCRDLARDLVVEYLRSIEDKDDRPTS